MLILALIPYRMVVNLLRYFLCTPAMSQNVTVSPHEFAQTACARCCILNTPPFRRSCAAGTSDPPALGELVTHLEDVDVLVHGLGLVAFGYALDLSAESVA